MESKELAAVDGQLKKGTPNFYMKSLTPTLKEAITEQLKQEPDAQTQLFEELALMRVYAGRFVAMYAAAVETGNEAKIMLAGEGMREALEAVANMCDKAHKLREKQKDRFSLFDIDHIVTQIVTIHHEVASEYQAITARSSLATGGAVGDYREMAKRFEEEIAKKLIMPNAAATGTTLHPDQTAALFDATVPRVDDDDALSDDLIDAMRETHQDLTEHLTMEAATVTKTQGPANGAT